jgi:hypothetical protein
VPQQNQPEQTTPDAKPEPLAISTEPLAHTPGPWYVGTQNDGLFILNQPPRPSNDDINPAGPKGLIIIGAVYGDVPFAEQQGNARLFAASWEMLEACRAFCRAVIEPKQDMEAERNSIVRAYHMGVAAIAKAEERQA